MKRKMRKSVSLLLVLSMLFSLLCGMGISASAADSTLSGGETITAGGEYQLASDAGGLITIQTTEPVVIIGNGAQWDSDGNMTTTPNVVSFDASAQAGANLTLQDVHIEGSSSYNTVNFTGAGNTLTIKGTCVIDHNVGAASVAGIHVGTGTALTIAGDGTLYFYKQAQGSGIGGNTGELNGDITFDMTGMLFAKGTKQGALIGAGSGASSTTETPGFVKFVSGTYNLMSVSRAACIGGSAGSGGASDGTTVYLEKDANVNINVDFSGAAVGGGGYDGGNDSSGGTLYVNGGSLRCYIDKNAAGNTTGYQGQEFTQGVNDAAITAQRLNGQNETVYRLAFDTTALETPATSFSVQVDGTDFYSGGLHAYGFVNENLDKADQVPISSTPSNWYENGETNLYFYVTGQDHSLTVNGETFAATWNETDKSFAVEKAAAETPDPDALVWNGVLDFRWYDENNVQTEYHITTPAQWEALAWICSEHLGQLSDYATYTNGNVTGIVGNIPTQQNTFEGVQFYLDNDIDMGGVYADGAWSGPNYYPVGSQASNDLNSEVWYGLFFGSFDGQGHVVKNVYCERSDNGSGVGGNGSQAGGLFGRLGAADGTDYPATDITIENIAVSGYFHGYRSFGGVVGKTLHVASGHSITVKNCVNFASVLTQNGAKGVGGVVGTLWNGASVDNCVNFGTVTGGYRSANVGGVSGAAEGPTSNSYNVGMVTNTATAANVGAVALNQSTADVTNCYALEGSAPGYPSSILNGNTLVSGGWKTAEEMKSADFVTLLGADNWGFPAETDGIASVMAENGVAGYPVPAAFVTKTEPQTPAQDAEGNYLISNADELVWFSNTVNGGDSLAGKTVTLANDIDLAGIDWMPIGGKTEEIPVPVSSQEELDAALAQYKLLYDNTGNSYKDGSDKNINYNPSYTYHYVSGTAFAGTFDGAGKSISNMTVNTDSGYAGLFGNVSGTVKDFTVSGSVTSTANGLDYVGGVTGLLSTGGTISGVTSQLAVTAEGVYNVGGIAGFVGARDASSKDNTKVINCMNTGAIMGYSQVGGITGENAGIISGCVNTGTIDGKKNTSKNGCGGIAGRNGNNNAAIEAGTIENCYNSGAIGNSQMKWVGGITGFNNELSVVKNCYDIGAVSGAGQYNPIVGQNEGNELKNGGVFNSYYLDTLRTNDANGVYGGNVDSLTGAKTADELKADDIVLALDANNDPAVWNKDADATLNSGYPVLKWQGGTEVVKAPAQDAEGNYLISNVDELIWFSNAVNGGETTINGKVTADIEVPSTTEWIPIGLDSNRYGGIFDGDGHTITLNL
ncbi:MAG: hypothetical protein IIY71_02245, partial [Oscillospiraceae bacterium]|nr:hypothetical protein [Oscillospiraceae bacterium]